MLCPYCNNEMKKGFLHSKSTPIWSEREKKLTIFASSNEVSLGGFLDGDTLTAYLCESCRTVIVKY